MKTFPIFLGILVSLLLLISFCYATEENVAQIQPAHDDAEVTKNGAEEEKFKYFHHHKPFFKKPFLKPIPHKYKPIPHYPILKKPYHPPVFPTHP